MKNVILCVDDLPTGRQLQHAIARLNKCCNLLREWAKGSKQEDPKALKAVSHFLDLLYKRERKNLRHDDITDDPYVEAIQSALLRSTLDDLSVISPDALRQQINACREHSVLKLLVEILQETPKT